MDIQRCPHCHASVAFAPDGSCPECRRFPTAAPESQAPSDHSPLERNPFAPPLSEFDLRPFSGPVKVKSYGLIPMTKSFYLTLQATLCIASIAGVILLRQIFAQPGHRLGYMKDVLLYLLLVALALEAVETIWMLKKFRKAEKERAQAKEPVP